MVPVAMTVVPSIISVIKQDTVDVDVVGVGCITTVKVVDALFTSVGVILDTLDPLPDHAYVYHPDPPDGIQVHTGDVRVCVRNKVSVGEGDGAETIVPLISV